MMEFQRDGMWVQGNISYFGFPWQGYINDCLFFVNYAHNCSIVKENCIGYVS